MRDLAHGNVQELRLVGVHEDGAHLILSGANGETFRLSLDEALRRAVSRPAPQRPLRAGGEGTDLSPRQIQAEIRAGATAEEVAERSGVPLARVQRYEGPVLAEREHIVRRAQSVEVPGHLPSHDTLRGPAAHEPATLGEMVAYRLSLHGVDAAQAEWDSWRRPDGQWTVVARFALPTGAPASIGEEPPALWTYHPVHRTITNANRWAQQLSELEPLDGPSPRRRLSAVSDHPFDIEAPESPRAEPALDREGELLDMLRARRGQRLGVDEDADDALALLLTHGIPAAHPRPSEVRDAGEGESAGDGAGLAHAPAPEDEAVSGAGQTPQPATPEPPEPAPVQRGGITSLLSRLNGRAPEDDQGHLGLRPGLSTATREITLVPTAPPRGDGTPEPGEPEGSAPDAEDGPGRTRSPGRDEPARRTEPGVRPEPPGSPEPPRPSDASRSGPAERPAPTGSAAAPPPDPQPRRSSRPKRSSVPSWDEIVFGTKGD
jgi:hypothetical protein